MESICPWWEYTPRLERYHYFRRKPQFELPVDQYETWTAFAVEEGEFHYSIGNGQGIAGEAQFVLCPPRTPFGRITEQPISFHYFVFTWVDHTGSSLAHEHFPKQMHWTFRNKHRLFSSLSLLRGMSPSNEDASLKWRDHLLLDIVRLYASEQENHVILENRGQSDLLMEHAYSLITNEYAELKHVQDWARRLGLSPVQFSRRFQRAYGINPSDYVSKLRIDHAIRLLTHTSQPLEEIAQQCGYNNGFYLSRVFSIKMGMSPSSYRDYHRV